MKFIASPTLIVAGDQDAKMLPSETRWLFEACRAEHKRLLWIRGGRHADLWRGASGEYAAAVDEMLAAVDASRGK